MDDNTEKKYTVYIIRNPEGKLYKGVTNNLERRLYQHNEGLSRWINNKGPFELVHKEEYDSKTEALKREKFFKTGKGRDFLKSILNSSSSGRGAAR